MRLTSKGESRFQWMAGAFYEDVYDWWHYGTRIPGYMTTTAGNAQYLPATTTPGLRHPVPACPTEIYYSDYFDRRSSRPPCSASSPIDLTDNWSVTGGARWFEYDRDDSEIYERRRWVYPVGRRRPRADGGVESEGKDADTVLKFATQYQLHDTKMVYALYSEGFRLGGNNSAARRETGVVPLEYKPDTLKNYEVGLKSQWLDNRLQVNVTAFFMEWDDIQLNALGLERR